MKYLFILFCATSENMFAIDDSNLLNFCRLIVIRETPIKIKKKNYVSLLKVLCLSLHFLICLDLFAQTGEHEEELAEISEQRVIEINQEIETRLAGSEKIQSNLGIYDQSLIEAYWSLAELHRELDDYERASDIFVRFFWIYA